MRVPLSPNDALKLGKRLRRLLAADGITASLGRCHQAIARLHGYTSLHELQAAADRSAAPVNAAPLGALDPAPLGALDPAPLANSLGLPLPHAVALLRRLADTAPRHAPAPSDRLLYLVEDIGEKGFYDTYANRPVAGHQASRHGLEFFVADLWGPRSCDVQVRGAEDGTWRLLGARPAGDVNWHPPHRLPQGTIAAVFGRDVAERYWNWRDQQAGAGAVDAFYAALPVRLSGLGPAAPGVTRVLDGVALTDTERFSRALLDDGDATHELVLSLPATESAVLAFLTRVARARGGEAAATAFERAEAVRQALLARGQPHRFHPFAPNVASHRQGLSSAADGDCRIRPDVLVDPASGTVQVAVTLSKALPDRAGLLPDLSAQEAYDAVFLPALDALPPEAEVEFCCVVHQGGAPARPPETLDERRARLAEAFSRVPRTWTGRSGREFTRPDPASEQEGRFTTQVDIETTFVVEVSWCGDAARTAERILAAVAERGEPMRALFAAAHAAEQRAYEGATASIPANTLS